MKENSKLEHPKIKADLRSQEASSLAKLDVNNNMSGRSWEMSLTAKTHILFVLLFGEFFAKLALEMQDDESLKAKATLNGLCKWAHKLLADRRDCMGQCYRLAAETLERQNSELFPTYSAINKIRMKYRQINDQGKTLREVNLRYKENPARMRELRGVLRTNEHSGNALRYKVLSYLTVHDLLVTEQIDLQEHASANQHIPQSQYYRERVRDSRGSLAFDPTVYAKVKNLKYELQVLDDSDSLISDSISEMSEDELSPIEPIEPKQPIMTKTPVPAMLEGQKDKDDQEGNAEDSTKPSDRSKGDPRVAMTMLGDNTEIDTCDVIKWVPILNHYCQQDENPSQIKSKSDKSKFTLSTADSEPGLKESSLPLKSCMKNTIAKLEKKRVLEEVAKVSIALLKAFHRMKGNKQAIRCQFMTAFDILPFNEEASRKMVTNDFVFYFYSTPTIPEWRDKATTYNETTAKNYCGRLAIKCSKEKGGQQQQMSNSSAEKLTSQIFLQKPDNFERSCFIKQLFQVPWCTDPFSSTSPFIMVVDRLEENDEPPYGYTYRRTVQCASKKKSDKVERVNLEILDEEGMEVEFGNPNCKCSV